MLAHLAQGDSFRQIFAHQLCRCCREKNLLTVSGGHDPRRTIQRCPEVVAVPKTAMTPSPVVLTMKPKDALIAWCRTVSCRASATCIAAGCCSHNIVLPSMSVNRNVTVPVGKCESAGNLSGRGMIIVRALNDT